MNDEEKLLWILVYVASVLTGKYNPKTMADAAIIEFNRGESDGD